MASAQSGSYLSFTNLSAHRSSSPSIHQSIQTIHPPIHPSTQTSIHPSSIHIPTSITSQSTTSMQPHLPNRIQPVTSNQRQNKSAGAEMAPAVTDAVIASLNQMLRCHLLSTLLKATHKSEHVEPHCIHLSIPSVEWQAWSSSWKVPASE